MDELRFRMIQALSAADIGQPLCDQMALICAEVAEQHCAERHAQEVARGEPDEVLETTAATMADDCAPAVVVAAER